MKKTKIENKTPPVGFEGSRAEGARVLIGFPQVLAAAGGAVVPPVGLSRSAARGADGCGGFAGAGVRSNTNRRALCPLFMRKRMASALLGHGGNGPGGQGLPERFAAGQQVGSVLGPGAPDADVVVAQQFLTGAAVVLHGVGGVVAQVQPGQHGAVVPVVYHIPPVVVCVGLGQAAVQIPQGAGGALEPGRS